jgi:hypothetical protein
MGEEEVSTYDRYLKFFSLRNTMLIMWLLILMVTIYPLGLPKVIAPETLDAYQTIIDALEPGSVVVWADEEQGMSRYIELRDGIRATLWHMADQGAKFVCVCLSPTSPVGIEYTFKYNEMESRYGFVYGEDWVILPYMAGEENALAALAENLWIQGVDYYGTPLADLPLMQNVHKVLKPDVDMTILGLSSTTFIHFYARQWLTPYPDDIRPPSVSWYGFASWMPYYPRYNQGASLRGIDIELATGYLGEDVIKYDAGNIAWAYTFITFIMATILKAYSKAKGQKIEAKIGE